jgi:hypothetical protein
MMKLRTVHKRARRNRKLSPSALERILLCNRFAASSEAFRVKMSSYFDYGQGYDSLSQASSAIQNGQPIRYYFKVFYAIKDRIMDTFGKLGGYSLQYWTSSADDYYGDDYQENGCHHYHILERVRLGKYILHRPTGHFSFSNDVTEYYKESVGFDEMKKLCTETIKGKKRERLESIPSADEARKALYWLAKQFGRLPVKEKIRPRVTAGYYQHSYLPPTNFNPQPIADDDSIPF